ncbi:mitogen-activated protein kinase [Haematococcus lacustris]
MKTEPAMVEDGDKEVEYTLKRDTFTNREYNSFLVCGSVFECPAKYLPLKPIGKGAYGVVCSARDLETNTKVAIKKIANAFENSVDAKRTLREIKLLRHLSHENIVQILDIIPPVTRTQFRDVYIVYELMDTDLHQIIRSPQPLSDDHCQYFIYEVLRGLKFIHSAQILHRDLKPSNLLVNANCDLKICDFGLARTAASNQEEFMTEYVVTRWYRAPELLLSCSEYGNAIDVWSVGCILAELLGRKPLFPGKDYVHQLNLITRLIGSPSEAELGFITSDKARRYIRALPRCERTDLRRLWPNANAKAVDLIDRMLVFDPSARISVEAALAHPYLASLHDDSDEPSCATSFDLDLDSEQLTPDVVREIILRDVVAMHPEYADEMSSAQAAAAAERARQQALHQQHTMGLRAPTSGPGPLPVAPHAATLLMSSDHSS